MQGFLIAAAVAVLANGPGTAAAKPKAITSQAEFASAVVGKHMTAGKGNEVVVTAGGSMEGMVGGQAITASSWQWKGNQFCRTLSTAKKDFPTACQNVTLDGKAVTFGKTRWTLD